MEHVKKVEAESRPVGRTSPPPTAAVGVSTSGSGRGTTAPVSEVGGFVAYSAAALEGLHCHNIGPVIGVVTLVTVTVGNDTSYDVCANVFLALLLCM